MSSREIAELVGKLHKNVKRDIAAMLKDMKLYASIDAYIYASHRSPQPWPKKNLAKPYTHSYTG